MFNSFKFLDPSIVMAQQSSRDVVDQTLSGGEPSSSDVPASTKDMTFAGGDVEGAKHSVPISNMQTTSERQTDDDTRPTLESTSERIGGDKNGEDYAAVGGSGALWDDGRNRGLNVLQDSSRQGAGLVASRALELNGLASASDGGDDTGSLGGSESDTSRTDSRNHTRTGSVKKSAFKPVSFKKVAVPKAPGVPAPSKVPEKGIVVIYI